MFISEILFFYLFYLGELKSIIGGIEALWDSNR